VKPKKDLLKISQLAQRAGVTVPTVKHYVREGLLPRPQKTSRNMAYYSETCIKRIRLIKKLQKEKFLPLEVIKRLIDSGESLDEELALGKALLKTDRFSSGPNPVVRSQVEALTGYPLDKIDILEQKDLIHPMVKGDTKTYAPEDVDLIQIMKLRDDMGVPVDTSLATLRIYKDAMTRAVSEDIDFFVRNTMGDIPTRQAIRFITEADETLDRFIISYRQKALKQITEKTIKTINRLPEDLAVMSILPVAGTQLPSEPPTAPYEKAFYYLLKGSYHLFFGPRALKEFTDPSPNLQVLPIFAAVMAGETDKALALVHRIIPKPSYHLLGNTVAALAYLFSISSSSGLSIPMFNIKKVFAYLKRVDQIKDNNIIVDLFSRYVCGAVYIFLPGVFNTRRAGIDMLEKLNRQLEDLVFDDADRPAWLARTLDLEVAPALKIRINRFLAKGYLEMGDNQATLACLDTIADLADADSEAMAWAKLERVRAVK
jgi:DNA-binding transcriptional MerR regulator